MGIFPYYKIQLLLAPSDGPSIHRVVQWNTFPKSGTRRGTKGRTSLHCPAHETLGFARLVPSLGKDEEVTSACPFRYSPSPSFLLKVNMLSSSLYFPPFFHSFFSLTTSVLSRPPSRDRVGNQSLEERRKEGKGQEELEKWKEKASLKKESRLRLGFRIESKRSRERASEWEG